MVCVSEGNKHRLVYHLLDCLIESTLDSVTRKEARPNEAVTQRISWQLRHQDVADDAAHGAVWCLDCLAEVA